MRLWAQGITSASQPVHRCEAACLHEASGRGDANRAHRPDEGSDCNYDSPV